MYLGRCVHGLSGFTYWSLGVREGGRVCMCVCCHTGGITPRRDGIYREEVEHLAIAIDTPLMMMVVVVVVEQVLLSVVLSNDPCI